MAMTEESETMSADAEHNLCLLSVPTDSNKLGNQAFLRDGQRGLRPVAIPAELGYLWRAGVALSDLTGFGEDVDAYPQSLDELSSNAESTSMPREFLKHALRRLRGCFVGNYELRPDKKKQYLPATLARVLSALTDFPDSADSDEAVVFTLAFAFETRAMSLRLTDEWPLATAGVAAHFLERSVVQATARLSKAFFVRIPSPGNVFSGRALRRPVHAWKAIGTRAGKLTPPKLGDIVEIWDVLLAGYRLASIVAWLRSLAFELAADNRSNVSVESAADLPPVWGINPDALLLTGSIGKGTNLSRAFRDAVGGSYRDFRRLIQGVTPLGWLAVVADCLGIIDESGPLGFRTSSPSDAEQIRSDFCWLARQLAPTSNTVPDPALWPFGEVLSYSKTLWDSDFELRAFDFLQVLDDACNFTVHIVHEKRWRYDRETHTFTDTEGTKWSLPPWRINQLELGKPESRLVDGSYVSNWSETRDGSNKLLNVGVLKQFYSELSGLQRRLNTDADISLTDDKPKSPDIEQPSKQSISPDSPTEPASGYVPPKPLPTAFGAPPALGVWTDLAYRSWADRAHRATNHARIAFVQWRADESYSHPMFDIPWPRDLKEAITTSDDCAIIAKHRQALLAEANALFEKGQPPANISQKDAQELAAAVVQDGRHNLWRDSYLIGSWVEHRRRRLLSAVLDACTRFKVDILVLPEYSVRPDTVAWLASELREKVGFQGSILAGTYRLHGNKSDLHFSAQFKDALGVSDYDKLIANISGGSSVSGEKSAIATLLTRLSDTTESRDDAVVSVFSRRKKYPSTAADEIFNPGLDEWQPLFTLDALLDDLERRDLQGRRSEQSNKSAVDTRRMLRLAEQHLPEQVIAELICSELFLPTNPANYKSIADAYWQLLLRFGTSMHVPTPIEVVERDLLAIAKYLGLPSLRRRDQTERTGDLLRRTILLVPAMTTRSADYWIFGQSALLAAGITTVFCNTAEDKHSIGGSCVIGRDSWKSETNANGERNTPYSGWSRGIYFNKAEDSLGKKEQALVIVDIDPLYMNEGKPRPQSLANPLRLVAHLPIAEVFSPPPNGAMVSETARCKLSDEHNLHDKSMLQEKLARILEIGKAAAKDQVWNPESITEGTTQTLFVAALALQDFFSEPSSYEARLRHWQRNFRSLPWTGPPPSLFDCIWLDLSLPSDEELPRIFVPPWGK